MIKIEIKLTGVIKSEAVKALNELGFYDFSLDSSTNTITLNLDDCFGDFEEYVKGFLNVKEDVSKKLKR